MSEKQIVIFDGVCNFCNGAVNFIIKRDSKNKFVFTPMQSSFAKSLIEKYCIDNVGVDTFLLVKDSRSFIWTDAALEIAKELDGAWSLFLVLRLVPRWFRDFLYRLFARNRYKLFGRTESCVVPTAELRARFLGLDS